LNSALRPWCGSTASSPDSRLRRIPIAAARHCIIIAALGIIACGLMTAGHSGEPEGEQQFSNRSGVIFALG